LGPWSSSKFEKGKKHHWLRQTMSLTHSHTTVGEKDDLPDALVEFSSKVDEGEKHFWLRQTM